jgi:hypothetical protein
MWHAPLKSQHRIMCQVYTEGVHFEEGIYNLTLQEA